LKFSVRGASNVIEITVPHPTVPEQDSRAIGLGFVQMRIAGDLSSLPEVAPRPISPDFASTEPQSKG